MIIICISNIDISYSFEKATQNCLTSLIQIAVLYNMSLFQIWKHNTCLLTFAFDSKFANAILK